MTTGVMNNNRKLKSSMTRMLHEHNWLFMEYSFVMSDALR